MRTMFILSALVLIVPLASCGRYGPIKSAPGSTYPQSYPNASLAGVSAPGSSGASAADKDRQFTAKGAYIDPSVHAPVIYGAAVVTGLPAGPFSGGFNSTQTPGVADPGTPVNSPP